MKNLLLAVLVVMIMLMLSSCGKDPVKIYTVSGEEGSRKIVCYGIVESDKDGQVNVIARVSESDIRYITDGQPVLISGSGFDRSEYLGEIAETGDTAEHTQSGSFVSCVVKITDPDNSVLDGFTARIEATVSVEDSVVIPITAIGYESEGFYVEIIKDGEIIKTGISNVELSGSNMTICKGIKSGDRIIEDLH